MTRVVRETLEFGRFFGYLLRGDFVVIGMSIYIKYGYCLLLFNDNTVSEYGSNFLRIKIKQFSFRL